MRWLSKAISLLAVAAAILVAVPALQPRSDTAPLPPIEGLALNDVKAWGYQLQNVDPNAIPADVDLLVTDHSRDGSDFGAWTRSEVAQLRRRDGGKPRIVLAYLSIGEAEAYRGYWRNHWRVARPRWLGPENKDWKGNFAVRFWDPDWQRLIVDADPSLMSRTLRYWFPAGFPVPYLDRILAAGFDGVFLDKVDGYEDWAEARPRAASDMVRWVGAISDYARRRRPGFLVVPQNAEELLAEPAYREKIDAVVKEDLSYGIAGDGQPNTADEVATAEQFLVAAAAGGRPIFVVEYVADPEARNNLRLKYAALGFRVLFAVRELNLPPDVDAPPGDQGSASPK